MKRIILSLSLCLCFYGSMSAQSRIPSRSELENAIMKKYNEELAKRRKAEERARQEKIKTEQRHARQQQGLERTFTRQMDNLNSYSTDNFVQGPQQSNASRYYQATTYKQRNKKTVPQATPKKNTNNNSADKNTPPQYGGSNSLIPTGKGYTGDRYTKKRSGFDKNKPLQQANYSESTIRGMVKPGRTMYNNTVISSSAKKPKMSVPQSPQPVNKQNGGKGKTDQTLTKQNDATKQKNPTNTQLQKKKQLPVQDKAVTVNKFGKIDIDTSKGPIYPNTQKYQTSTDFDNTVVQKPDGPQTQQQKPKQVTVYQLPQQAYKLSHNAEDNNLSDNNHNKLPAKPKTASDEITEKDLYNKSMKLLQSGASLSEWAELSNYGYSRQIKTKRTITQKRK